MRRFYPNFQYVIATHIDKDHVHNHILINSVDFKTFHKLHSNKQTLAQLRVVSDDICLENGLSTIDKDETLFQKRSLREAAFTEIENYFSGAYSCIIKITQPVSEYSTVLFEEEQQDERDNSLSDEEIRLYNKNILDNLETAESNVKASLEKYVDENYEDIEKKTSFSVSDFAKSLINNIGKAFKKFRNAEQKKNSPLRPKVLKRNLQGKIFTAIEQTYNNIPKNFNHKNRLKNYLDKAIQEAADYDSFVGLMQEAGYEVKFSEKKGLAFKDENMKRFMYSKSISLDYSESMIKYRIKNRKEPPECVKKRTVYDDKIKVRNKRKKIRLEIDASIKKANTYDEFIADMQRKHIEVKQGKHLAFRDLNQPDNGKAHRFQRADSLGSHYTENVIKFRIEHREEYNKMMEHTVDKIIPILPKDDAELASWKRGNNVQIRTNTESWIIGNLLKRHGYNPIDIFQGGKEKQFAINELYGCFLEEYEKQINIINAKENEINEVSNEMNDIQKHIRAIDNYWKLKPILKRYVHVNPQTLSENEAQVYKSLLSKWRYTTDMLESAKEKYNTLSTKELGTIYNELEDDLKQLQEEYTELNLDFETWENIKFNIETDRQKGGFGYGGVGKYSPEYCKNLWEFRKNNDLEVLQKKAEKVEQRAVRKEGRKETMRKFFGLTK
ncbi:MAG: relaxase/mobilization nuclease domain-containing protein [Clostridiales bacterium]|nr:relaxase/mobilization nuclease domain-containing protein [Clostridiales bacterium]